MKSTNIRSIYRVMLVLSLAALFSNFKPFPAEESPQESIDTRYYYRLTTQWQGDGKSLDVVNDGNNNRLQLANTGNYSGQFWKFTNLGGGFYRMTTQWQGDGKSLDVINDGNNNQIQLANTGNYSGQFWKVQSMGNGYYRLTTQWQGEGKSLDVVNDGINNRLQLAATGNYSGQYWKLTPLSPVPTQQATPQPEQPAKPAASLKWEPFRGGIPSNAVNGGQENGRSLPVCRTNYNGAMHPGKVVANMCNIGWGGKEIVARSYEVLVNDGGVSLTWVRYRGQMPANAVVAGKEGNNTLYVGQALMSNGSVHPGKVFRAETGQYICNYGYGGREVVEKVNFNILVQN